MSELFRRMCARLARDTRGNVMAMMAISLIPIAAMTGSALDLSRAYLVKSRLQQACDAGVLATRRSMVGNTLAEADRTQGDKFFRFNFPDGMFGTKASTTDIDLTIGTEPGAVDAAASTVLPWTVMKMFGQTETTLRVACQSKLDVTNMDVMFVLDVTGSMACTASQSTSDCSTYIGQTGYSKNGAGRWTAVEKDGSRIAALRVAVLAFYDTLSASASSTTRMRFGFVPYATTANVRNVLPSGAVSGQWSYQTRRLLEWGRINNPSASSYNNGDLATCRSRAVARAPASGYDQYGNATQTITTFIAGPYGGLGNQYDYYGSRCYADQVTLRAAKSNDSPAPVWVYTRVALDAAQMVAGSQMTDPTRVNNSQIGWNGCVEERDQPADLDTMPTNGATRWRPYIPEVEYERPDTGDMVSIRDTDQPSYVSGAASCPSAATKLAKMSRSEVQNYVSASSGFLPHGGTYHDVGMIWGGRLISPDGLYATDNRSQNGESISRNIVFITDGDMAPTFSTYSTNGMDYLDQRMLGRRATDVELKDNHNARFNAACEAVKDKQITVWVVAYAQAMTQQLKDCATDSTHAIFAPDDPTLRAKLQEIATRIAALRLNK